MRVYYLNEEYETGKHRIQTVWISGAKPEDSTKTAINIPYTVIDIDEEYNPTAYEIAKRYAPQTIGGSNITIPAKYYVNNSGQIINNDTGQIVAITPNPNKATFKLSQLYGLTQAQLETYIDNNVTNIATAKTFLKKLSAVVLYLVKQTRLDQ